MLKNLIILPDGTELYSGNGRYNNIRSACLKQCVNSETELTLGSVCSAMLECKIQTPNGGLNLAAGTEITLYKVDDAGTRHKVGLFTLEKPTRPSAHTYKITAYDRISWLDKNLTEWLASLDGWPYSVFDFAHMVAGECGLVLKNTSLLNGSYQIQKFSGQGVTGRKLMEWIGQICAKFCRATPDGEIEFAWYARKYNIEIAPSAYTKEGAGYDVAFADGNLTITSPAVESSDDGNGSVTIESLVVVSDDGDGNLVVAVDDGARSGLPFFAHSLTYEDYETASIEKVQIRLTEDDVGAVHPQVTGEVNTYTITGNYLLTTDDADALQGVAQGIYNAICNIRYTPCEVSVAANLGISAGDIVCITDRNGKTITTCIMTRTQRGQRDTLECTGSPRRDSSTVVNNETLKSLSGKVLEVRKSIDGLNVKATKLDSKIAEVDIKADGISANVTALEQKVDTNAEQAKSQTAEVSLKADGISASVREVQQQVDTANGKAAQNAEELAQVKTSIAEIQVAAGEVSIRVQSIVDNGVPQVTTGMGYTFNDEGLSIQKPGGEMLNQLDDTGMEVSRSGEVMLRADKDGVVATDVAIRNFLTVGDHARFEDYSNGTDTKRTACFHI